MLRKSMMVNKADNVAMVLEDSKKGDTIDTSYGTIVLREDVEFAHKVALVPMKKGEPVIKYHEEIGRMMCDISAGTWIHNHNMECKIGSQKEGKNNDNF